MIIGLLSAVGTGVCQPLNMLIFGTLTGDIIEYASLLMGDYTEAERIEAADKFLDSVIDFVIYNCSIGVAMLVLSYISTLVFNWSGTRQIFKVRTIFLERVLNQDIAWYDKNQTGDFASRMSE